MKAFVHSFPAILFALSKWSVGNALGSGMYPSLDKRERRPIKSIHFSCQTSSQSKMLCPFLLRKSHGELNCVVQCLEAPKCQLKHAKWESLHAVVGKYLWNKTLLQICSFPNIKNEALFFAVGAKIWPIWQWLHAVKWPISSHLCSHWNLAVNGTFQGSAMLFGGLGHPKHEWMNEWSFLVQMRWKTEANSILSGTYKSIGIFFTWDQWNSQSKKNKTKGHQGDKCSGCQGGRGSIIVTPLASVMPPIATPLWRCPPPPLKKKAGRSAPRGSFESQGSRVQPLEDLLGAREAEHGFPSLRRSSEGQGDHSWSLIPSEHLRDRTGWDRYGICPWVYHPRNPTELNSIN